MIFGQYVMEESRQQHDVGVGHKSVVFLMKMLSTRGFESWKFTECIDTWLIQIGKWCRFVAGLLDSVEV